MSRARDLADAGSKANYLDNVSADINTTYAPLASPTFTGTTNVSSGVTLPAGHVISTQIFVGTGSNTTASWATSASYQTTGLTTGSLSHGSGNKILLTGRFYATVVVVVMISRFMWDLRVQQVKRIPSFISQIPMMHSFGSRFRIFI